MLKKRDNLIKELKARDTEVAAFGFFTHIPPLTPTHAMTEIHALEFFSGIGGLVCG